MFRFLTIFALALAVQAEYRPDEHLVLADCGIHPPNGDSTSRQMIYYSGHAWDSNGKWVKPDMMVNIPWDGSYPWRNGGVRATFPNGDNFWVAVSPTKPDSSDKVGMGGHTYEPHTFLCWGHHQRGIYYLDDGTECASAYICDHYAGPSPAPPSPNTASSTITLSSDAIEIQDSGISQNGLHLVNPKDVFHSVYDALEGNGCKRTHYAFDNGCSISYSCMFAGNDNEVAERRKAVADLLYGTAGPKIAESYATWTTYSSEWGIPQHHIGYKYPRSGQIVTTHSDSIQSQLSFEITCSGSWFCNKGCGLLTTGMIALGYSSHLIPVGVFGTLVAGACGQSC